MQGGRSAPKVNKTAGQGNLTSNAKGKGPSTRRPTIPFQPTDTILLIGEGDFSFARALARPSASRTELAHLAHLPPKNITATAYDSEESCYSKYPDAEEILERVSKFKGRKWSKIVWNFPHAGKGIDDQDRNILSNQMLILGFLRSAAKFLKEGPVPSILGAGKNKRKVDDDEEEEEIQSEQEELDDDMDSPIETQTAKGTILITLRNVVPYTSWDVPRLAKNPPPPMQGSTPSNPRYTLLRSFAFRREIWDGYEHRMTKGLRAHGTGKTGEGGEDRTWEFYLKDNNIDS
ncbi:hypothetical protein BT96DRAFT_986421 [Gymnopus androsaceus JB14]|uniref:25S rRNA (uridine-N(3))-methyltransferase BMT5-like domain-containing protein n=1 Tax=Gymnopus androsaceus JB14 TaxID=1447944 RepID=A0A6A4IAU7_9AGAR|nr:hypothetical protein BT96DRAFT_986421 [Gymnopus androsaceus JB14]